jgi:hypothetical protein
MLIPLSREPAILAYHLGELTVSAKPGKLRRQLFQFYHLGKHLMKPSDYYEILLCKILYFVGDTGLLED